MLISRKTKNRILREIQQKKDSIKQFIYNHYYLKHIKVQEDIILFECMLGRNYSGNPKGIYEEMVRQGLDKKYRIYWIFEEPDKMEIIGNAKKIKRNRLRHLKYLCKAKMWVFDTRQPNFVVKKLETTYIQTWHGTPLKKLGLDMDDVQMAGNKGIENYKANFWANSRRWDYLIAQNQYSSDIFKSCFDFQKNMLDIGYPRNDTLIRNNNKEYIDRLKEKHGIPRDKKVVLYAPTWRDNQSMGKGKYIFNPFLNFDILKRNVEDEYAFILKYHYLIASELDWSRMEGFIYDIKEDIQELYLMADILMTDYSSVMFDYSILKRPMIFYTYDLDDYCDNRGFYFDFLAEAPGPFVKNTDELIAVLKEHNFEQYKEKYDAFNKKYNSWDDGRASEKVVEIIKETMK
ncbi:MAG: CDP-glycerol glycerophosphotransferase family protein [Acetivibrio ethanolgignens]